MQVLDNEIGIYNIGDTKYVMGSSGRKYIVTLTDCIDCKRLIWQKWVMGKPANERCKSCAQILRHKLDTEVLYKGTIDNPEIGDIRRGKELGKKNNRKYSFLPCTQCNKPRWVGIFKGKARTDICPNCRSILVGIHNIKPRGTFAKGTIDCPIVGDIRYGDEIGSEYFKSIKYKFDKCLKCGKERWLRGDSISNICKECYLKNRPIGKNNKQSKGGHINKQGYRVVCIHKDSPYWKMGQKHSKNLRTVIEHRLVMAIHLGRCLKPWEEVHHLGSKYPKGSWEDKHDNRIENLELETGARHQGFTTLENQVRQLESKVDKLQQELKSNKQITLFLLWLAKENKIIGDEV